MKEYQEYEHHPERSSRWQANSRRTMTTVETYHKEIYKNALNLGGTLSDLKVPKPEENLPNAVEHHGTHSAWDVTNNANKQYVWLRYDCSLTRTRQQKKRPLAGPSLLKQGL